jgi:hypothetical protein
MGQILNLNAATCFLDLITGTKFPACGQAKQTCCSIFNAEKAMAELLLLVLKRWLGEGANSL